MDIAALFEKHDDKSYKDQPDGPDDLTAFTLLNRLVPGAHRMISGAEHDQIWLDVDLDELAKVASEDDIITLIRCGVWLDDEDECLCMFR